LSIICSSKEPQAPYVIVASCSIVYGLSFSTPAFTNPQSISVGLELRGFAAIPSRSNNARAKILTFSVLYMPAPRLHKVLFEWAVLLVELLNHARVHDYHLIFIRIHAMCPKFTHRLEPVADWSPYR
jgi:hypothetical protein